MRVTALSTARWKTPTSISTYGFAVVASSRGTPRETVLRRTASARWPTDSGSFRPRSPITTRCRRAGWPAGWMPSLSSSSGSGSLEGLSAGALASGVAPRSGSNSAVWIGGFQTRGCSLVGMKGSLEASLGSTSGDGFLPLKGARTMLSRLWRAESSVFVCSCFVNGSSGRSSIEMRTWPPDACVSLSSSSIHCAWPIFSLGERGFSSSLRTLIGTARSERMQHPTKEASRCFVGSISATEMFCWSHTSITICGASSSGGNHACSVNVSNQSGSLVLVTIVERS